MMEIESAKLLSDLLKDDSTFFHEEQMNSLDNQLNGVNFLQSIHSNHGFFSEAASRYAVDERSTKQTNSFNSCSADHISSIASPLISSQIISFGNSSTSYPPASQLVSGSKYAMIPKNEPRTPLHTQDHLVAERKRRERLSQLLIALSALVPGLKKTDKASVLGDAAKYLKQLQERIKKLEEQAAKTTMESMVVNKTYIFVEEDETNSPSDEMSYSQSKLPEIDVRVSDRDVLVRIHCEKKEDCIINILEEIEKHNLTVGKTNVLPFGNSILAITIVAQMDVEFSMTVKDLVKNLRLALLHPSAIKKLC